MDNELKNLDVINSDTIQSIRLNNYVMDNNKFQNLNQCRVEFGLFGGNNVSQTKSNIIDVDYHKRTYISIPVTSSSRQVGNNLPT